eukprot:6159683-Amphidinium_carterae.1
MQSNWTACQIAAETFKGATRHIGCAHVAWSLCEGRMDFHQEVSRRRQAKLARVGAKASDAPRRFLMQMKRVG